MSGLLFFAISFAAADVQLKRIAANARIHAVTPRALHDDARRGFLIVVLRVVMLRATVPAFARICVEIDCVKRLGHFLGYPGQSPEITCACSASAGCAQSIGEKTLKQPPQIVARVSALGRFGFEAVNARVAFGATELAAVDAV